MVDEELSEVEQIVHDLTRETVFRAAELLGGLMNIEPTMTSTQSLRLVRAVHTYLDKVQEWT